MTKKNYQYFTTKLTSEQTFRYQQRSLSLKHLIKQGRLTDICDLIGDRPESIPKYLNRVTEQSKPSENGGLS